MKKVSPKVQELNDWFSAMAAVRNGTTNTSSVTTTPFKRMKDDEELYYGDVDGTGTQLTKQQLQFIKEKYDVPISSKINYAIIEQVKSFLTGGKPFPRLIGASDVTREWSMAWEKIFAAWWYECGMNGKFEQIVGDYAVVGQGWVEIREDNFYSESTFGIISDYVRWTDVYVDPTSRKPDASDAEIVCVCEPMLKTKAEKFFGIKINDDDEEINVDWLGIVSSEDGNTVANPNDLMGVYFNATEKGKNKFKKVWTRRFYQQVQTTIYIDENGNVGIKPPRPIEIPNPEKVALEQQMMALRAQGEQLTAQAQQGLQQDQMAEEAAANGQDPAMLAMQTAERGAQDDQALQQAAELGNQYRQMQAQWAQMPDKVPAYELELIEGGTVTSREIDKKVERRIKKTVMLGNRIMEDKILPIDSFPLIPVTMNFMGSFNRCFGMTHYVKDLVKAINKFWSQMIYDMQLNNGRRMLFAQGTILEPSQVEKDWAKPGAWIEYEANPVLQDGGRPTPIDGTPLSPAIKEAVAMLIGQAEYTTGIGSLQQGQMTNGTPDTFGGIQTMQTFGTQRIKLYARHLENFLERFAYVGVQMLQAYMPKDKAVLYFDENGDQQEIQYYESKEDTRFKVRVNITSSMPTQRHMAAQIMGILSGQTKNPQVADLLTKHTLRYLDLPEADKIAEEVDTVTMLGQQMQQLQTQNQTQEKELSQVKQQLMQKDIEMAKLKATMEIEGAKDLKIQAIEMADDARELQYQGGNVGNDSARVTADDNVS